MKSNKPQKIIIPCILNILKEYTDENHTMIQEDIGKKFKEIYGEEIERKTLSRNLRTIIYNFDEVKCTIKDRKGRILSDEDDDAGAIYTDFYYEHIFSKVELQAIVNNIVFAKHISKHHKEDLIGKLESLVPLSTRHDLKSYIRDDRKYEHEYEELFFNLEILDEAIAAKEIVKFKYATYKEDMKLHTDERIWYVFPLGIAEKNNDNYLVGLVCGSEKETPEELLKDVMKLIENFERGSRFLDTFRIDRIRQLNAIDEDNDEIQLSEADKKLAKTMSMRSFKKTWSNIQDYVSQNSSLYPGRNITAKFKMYNEIEESISEAVDFFGKENVRIEKSTDKDQGKVLIFTVDTNDRAMLEFSKTYAKNVEVISPDYLRNELIEIFKTAYERMC